MCSSQKNRFVRSAAHAQRPSELVRRAKPDRARPRILERSGMVQGHIGEASLAADSGERHFVHLGWPVDRSMG